ncbi:MAG: SIMPL domain-containing protein [Patescibacteria group bacterium]|nr:SIMPL domain-containing protein [Patescibacteria group bacterium]
MSDKLRNYLGIAVIISILVLASSAWSYTRSYSKSIEPSSFRSFSVSGEGKVITVPDVAEFTFSVVTEGETDIAGLQDENTGKVNQAIAFVKSSGVDDKDIKTQSYNLTPRYQRYSCPRAAVEAEPCPPPEIVGYTITQTILVKVRDFTVIGNILAGVVQSGANTVSQLNFTIDDPDQFQSEARAEAIAKANEKAKSIAKAAGFRLGRLLSISESGRTPPPVFFREAALGVGGAVTPDIEPGSQEVVVNVTMSYEIE